MNLPRSVVLVTVDCLRADHCGFLGYDRPTTPFLDSLAASSFVFRNAIAAGAPTYYSFPVIMASRPPLALGRDVIGVAPGEATLASVLSNSGYRTAAFLAGNPYLSRRYGYEAGFDRFEDFLQRGSGARVSHRRADGSWRASVKASLLELSGRFGPMRRVYDEFNFRYHMRAAKKSAASLDQLRSCPAADVIVDRARQWLVDTGGQPFFLWLHLMDPHGPYLPPKEALEMMGERGFSPSRVHYLNEFWAWNNLPIERLRRHRAELLSLYDAGIRWVDTQMAVLVDTLKQSGAWQNCIFAFTADHGEEFLEHGGIGHLPPRLFEEMIHVPLVLHGPGIKRASAETAFSLIHLAPTLLEAVGFPAPENFRGTSHWTRLDDEDSWKSPVIAECTWNNPYRNPRGFEQRILAVREGNYKLILDFRSAREQMFDLKADPGEAHPLPAEAERPVHRRLLEHAQMHLADSIASADPSLRLGASLRTLRTIANAN